MIGKICMILKALHLLKDLCDLNDSKNFVCFECDLKDIGV